MLDRIARYYNTVKYLRPVQLVGQLQKNRVLRTVPALPALPHLPVARLLTLISSLDTDAPYLARFDVKQLMNNEVTLLNETHLLNLSTWRMDASPLWRFNLHYFEFAIALSAKFSQTGENCYYNKFKELVTSWVNVNPVGRGDAWHPYTISMRLPNWLICFDLFGEAFEADDAFRETVYQSIYAQYRILIKRKERWQLGNHYFENLKTILLCSLLFDELKIFNEHIKLFLHEVEEEILPDGVHFELSLMYHKVILEDILRVTFWLQQAGKLQWKELVPTLQSMINAAASLENGMRKTPLFNDSGDSVAKDCSALIKAANTLFDIKPALSDEFPNSGYYKLYDGNIALMMDAGAIGPSYMAGHGHCDCLSFELSVNDKPLFVNSGTYQYQGEYRKYFRSTKAHNTLTVGEREQSECWGEHRVARRISSVQAEKNGQIITGSYNSYSSSIHTRSLSLTDRILTVLDSVNTSPSQVVHSFLHIAPGFYVQIREHVIAVLFENIPICEIYAVESIVKLHTSGTLCCYSQRFGELLQGCCLEFSWQADSNQHGYRIHFGKETKK
ncbi:MAG: alginate lyase family protein [Clostridiaceae bacterium]|nr:alginate lyase family protein [Clostridiaceae bacterium]